MIINSCGMSYLYPLKIPVVTRTLLQINSYLSAGRLLHLITAIELCILVASVPWLTNWHPQTAFPLFLKYWLLTVACSLPILSQLDALSRFQNYKRARDHFLLYGFDPRLLHPYIKSRCQRDAALEAARVTGFTVECSRHFILRGYRWYHILPDYLFTHPQFLLTPDFWKTTFFAPYYKPRVPFEPAMQLQ